MIIASSILFLLILSSWLYLFNIYEVEVKVDSKIISAQSNYSSKIELIPLNSFGYKAPFRKLNSKLSFLSGQDLIESTAKSENEYLINSKSTIGKVELLLESEYFLYPNKITFEIKPNEGT